MDALGGGECARAHGDRDVDGDVAGIVNLNGDEPADSDAVAGGNIAGGDVGDGKIGEASVVIDLVVKEQAEVFVGGGLEYALEGVWILGGPGTGVANFVAVELKSSLERSVAGDGAQHEEDSGGFCPVIDLVVSGDKALSGLARRRWECGRERRGRGSVLRRA